MDALTKFFKQSSKRIHPLQLQILFRRLAAALSIKVFHVSGRVHVHRTAAQVDAQDALICKVRERKRKLEKRREKSGEERESKIGEWGRYKSSGGREKGKSLRGEEP